MARVAARLAVATLCTGSQVETDRRDDHAALTRVGGAWFELSSEAKAKIVALVIDDCKTQM